MEDHPLDYGDFEGTIPKGQYGGGTVQLWDRGYWDADDPERGFEKGDLKFTLHGEKLQRQLGAGADAPRPQSAASAPTGS